MQMNDDPDVCINLGDPLYQRSTMSPLFMSVQLGSQAGRGQHEACTEPLIIRHSFYIIC